MKKIEIILEELNKTLSTFADDDGVIRSVNPQNGLIYGEKVFDLLGKTVFGFMFNDLHIKQEYFEAHNRFLGLLSIRKMFLDIAQTNSKFKNSKPELLIYRANVQEGVLEFSGPGRRMIISSEGFIKPVYGRDILIELFENFDIPFNRVRICPICKKIFWASKANSESCGNKYCANTLGNYKRLEKKEKEF